MNVKNKKISACEAAKSGIKIKKANKGKFTDYCGGEVTDKCIQRGLNSKDPAVRKRANFARNARKWKHSEGGNLHTFKIYPNHILDSNPKLDNMKRYDNGGSFGWGNLASLGSQIFQGIGKLKLLSKVNNSLESQINSATAAAKKNVYNLGFQKFLNLIKQYENGIKDLYNKNGITINNSNAVTENRASIAALNGTADQQQLISEAAEELNLKRMDSFNNAVSGTISDTFSSILNSQGGLNKLKELFLKKNQTTINLGVTDLTALDISQSAGGGLSNTVKLFALNVKSLFQQGDGQSGVVN